MYIVQTATIESPTVGVEVLWNHRHLRPGEGQTHKASVAVVAVQDTRYGMLKQSAIKARPFQRIQKRFIKSIYKKYDGSYVLPHTHPQALPTLGNF